MSADVCCSRCYNCKLVSQKSGLLSLQFLMYSGVGERILDYVPGIYGNINTATEHILYTLTTRFFVGEFAIKSLIYIMSDFFINLLILVYNSLQMDHSQIPKS